MNTTITALIISFSAVIAAFFLGFCVGVKFGAKRVLKVLDYAIDEALTLSQKVALLDAMKKNSERK